MAQILHEVEPIDNLDGLRCPLPNPLSVHWSDKTQLLDLFNGLHEPPFRVFPSHYSTTHLNLSSSRMAQTQEMLILMANSSERSPYAATSRRAVKGERRVLAWGVPSHH